MPILLRHIKKLYYFKKIEIFFNLIQLNDIVSLKLFWTIYQEYFMKIKKIFFEYLHNMIQESHVTYIKFLMILLTLENIINSLK